jgi:hypothetical protein
MEISAVKNTAEAARSVGFRDLDLGTMNLKLIVDKRHKFRLALCGHKAVETGAACLLLMVQEQLAQATLGHFLIASETGILTVFPLLGITLTRHARHFANRWISGAFVAVCSFFADALIHSSHYPGDYTEAALTAVGAFVLSIVVSYTPIGKHLDGLAEGFLLRGVDKPEASGINRSAEGI